MQKVNRLNVLFQMHNNSEQWFAKSNLMFQVIITHSTLVRGDRKKNITSLLQRDFPISTIICSGCDLTKTDFWMFKRVSRQIKVRKPEKEKEQLEKKDQKAAKEIKNHQND